MLHEYISPVADHLWQSTIFASAALVLSLALRKNRAQTRYWLWLAASIKFLVPFSLLVTIGERLDWRTHIVLSRPASSAIEQISQPFTMTPMVSTPAAPESAPILPVVGSLWLAGAAVVVSIWFMRWRRLEAQARGAMPLPISSPIPVMTLTSRMEPGVFGVIRPVLLLPEGIAERLSPAQLSAILAHELCHLRRRDNLAAAVHMVVEALFWFHPLVWWIGARLVEERERACDEEVLRMGNEPQAYAEGILNVCKFYLESPLRCAAGVTGADLKRRIAAIMTGGISHSLSTTRKLLLAAAGATVFAGPIFVGILNAPRMRAQSAASDLSFEVASIRPSDPNARGVRIQFLPGGGLRAENARVRQLIEFAYHIQNFQLSGGPGWITSEGFDILAKAPASAEAVGGSVGRGTDRQAVGQLKKARLGNLTSVSTQANIVEVCPVADLWCGNVLTISRRGRSNMKARSTGLS